MIQYPYPNQLESFVEDGYITKREYKTSKNHLFCYSYTAKCEYEDMWNYNTMWARGLILDKDYNVVARPFKKFFNYHELNESKQNEILYQNLPFTVYEKIDGSMITVTKHNDEIIVCGKRNFDSLQANKARELLDHDEYYREWLNYIENGYTYVFEIYYPENRIVIDYGDKPFMKLLKIFDNSVPLIGGFEDIGGCSNYELYKNSYQFFGKINEYHFDSISELLKNRNCKDELQEGFVVQLSNGLRFKWKFQEYLELHRISKKTSIQSVFNYFKMTKTEEEFWDKADIYKYINVEHNNKLAKYIYDEIVENISKICDWYYIEYQHCYQILYDYRHLHKQLDRKDLVAIIKKEYPKHFHILMHMYDKKFRKLHKAILKFIEENYL